MNGSNRKTLGVIFIVLGALFVLQLSGVINQIFFAGWWTLFLIIPALVHIIKHGIQTGNMVLFGLGMFFLLDELGYNLSGFLLPIVFIAIGIGILFRNR